MRVVNGRLKYRTHARFGAVVTPGGALRECRLAMKHDQRSFASLIGVSLRTLSRWEFDDHQPPRSERVRVMTWLADAPPALVRTLANAWGLPTPEHALPPAPPPAPVVPARAMLDAIVFASAEDLDVSPRRLRVAMAHLLREIERLQLTPAAAREQLESRAKVTTPPAK